MYGTLMRPCAAQLTRVGNYVYIPGARVVNETNKHGEE